MINFSAVKCLWKSIAFISRNARCLIWLRQQIVMPSTVMYRIKNYRITDPNYRLLSVYYVLIHCFQLLITLVTSPLQSCLNELPAASSNLANLCSDSTEWVLLHGNISKLNHFKGRSSSSWKSLFYEALCNNLQVILLSEYSTLCTAQLFNYIQKSCGWWFSETIFAVWASSVDLHAEKWFRISYHL